MHPHICLSVIPLQQTQKKGSGSRLQPPESFGPQQRQGERQAVTRRETSKGLESSSGLGGAAAPGGSGAGKVGLGRGWEARLARQVGLGCSPRCSHAPEQPLGDLREHGGFCKEMAP